MAEFMEPGPVADTAGIREAVCIHTRKIFDSCRDKDCVEDLRLYPATSSQAAIDRAISLKAGQAELLYTYIDVEPVGFNRGSYTVDVRYFYRVTADAFVGTARPVPICGLAIFDKRVILFGSEGNAKIFSSKTVLDGLDQPLLEKNNLPTAVVESVDPLILGMKLVDRGDCHPHDCCDGADIPLAIASAFPEELYFGGDGKRVYVTLGQFSIIRLERDSQLLIPAYDYCVPSKECTGGSEEDPCAVFRNVQFPMDEFFPPNTISQPESYADTKCCCAST
jgi:hypothetical protein